MRHPVSALVYLASRMANGWYFCLLKRVAMPQYGLPVFWQGVSGGVEDDESVDTAALRELSEETGITGERVYRTSHSRTFPIQKEWQKQYPPGTKEITEYTFVCIVDSTRDLKLSWEHSEYAWLSYDDAYNRLYYQGNKEALAAAKTWLMDYKQ